MIGTKPLPEFCSLYYSIEIAAPSARGATLEAPAAIAGHRRIAQEAIAAT